MDTRASDVTPVPQIICCCESPICSNDHPARYQPLPLDGPGAPDLSWLLAARRSRVGMAAAVVRQRVVRRTPRHA
jgi:hypothetical protein